MSRSNCTLTDNDYGATFRSKSNETSLVLIVAQPFVQIGRFQLFQACHILQDSKQDLKIYKTFNIGILAFSSSSIYG